MSRHSEDWWRGAASGLFIAGFADFISGRSAGEVVGHFVVSAIFFFIAFYRSPYAQASKED